MRRTFHSLVALMVALPLGVGGFCCCLLGHGEDEAPVVVQESHSCCSGEAAPAAPADEKSCECPARGLAVFAMGSPESPVPDVAPSALLVAPGTLSSFALAFAVEATVAPVPDPPPKRPLYRTLSVLRC